MDQRWVWGATKDRLRGRGTPGAPEEDVDGRKVIFVISKITKDKPGRIWDRSECPLSGVKRTFTGQT